MRHPYFSKHVTHFLWDGSEFDRKTAENDRCYDAAFVEDPRLKQYSVTRLRADVTDMDERATYVGYHEGEPGNSHWNALLKSGRNIDLWIHEDQVAELSAEEKLVIVGEGDCLPFYRVGSYHGKKQYAACFQTQVKLNSNWHLFIIASWAFKSLEHMSFSDFRALAYPEESYADLCRRLFGGMVRPKFSTAGGVQEFLCVLRVPHRGSWKSISIGYHPLLVNAFENIEQGVARDWQHGLGHYRLDELLSVEVLRLSVFSNGWQDNSVAHAQWGFGINMMSKLRELELDFDDLRAEEELMNCDSYDRTLNFDRAT
ncbi:hypothetical protein Q7P35_006674 [Cladosporium inversicolor]